MYAHDTDFRLLVAAATRAPSGHNSQPWRFRPTAGGITILPDDSRVLPAVDGGNREGFISLGCALENLCLYATTLHYAATATLDADGSIAVQLRRDDAIRPDPLAACIPHRQTNRTTGDGRTVAADSLQTLLGEATAATPVHAFACDTAAYRLLADAVRRGNEVQMHDRAFKKELLAWIRYNRADSERTGDGLSNAVLGAPDLPRWLAKIIVRAMLNARTQNRTDAKHLAAASHLLLITSGSDDHAAHVAAGRVLQRLLLRATAAGIATAFLNQPCEVAALRAGLRENLPIDGHHPQILLRIGYARKAACSRRRPIDDVIVPD